MLLLSLSLLLVNKVAYGQKSPSNKDSIVQRKLSDPAKASLYSSVLPGLGQGFNKKYWKIPVIYSVISGFAYLAITNQQQYKDFKNALVWRYDDDENTNDNFSQYNDQNLVTLKNLYRKRRDLAFAGIGLIYVLNIIDANVDAHLKNFDQKINENISLGIRPSLQNSYCINTGNFIPQIKVNLTWRSGKSH